MAIKKTFLVEKKNVLNEMRSTNMNLVELRFLTIYLSKINARELSSRVVRFPLAEFVKIMELQKVNISSIKSSTTSLLQKVVNIPSPNGGYTGFQLFKECRVEKNEEGSWFIEFDAHDRALPLMFEFKKDYFKYELWNALRLSSSNQIRMYEILKQYEYSGERILPLDELKSLLGIEKNAYPLYADFRKQVLDKAQAALLATTDICFTYEPIKKGQAGKVVSILFIIIRNKNYIDQLTIAEFIDLQKSGEVDEDIIGTELVGNHSVIDFPFLSEAFNNEFSIEDVEFLYFLSIPLIQHRFPNLSLTETQIKMHDYFTLKYSLLKAKSKIVKISRLGLLRSFIEADLKTIE